MSKQTTKSNLGVFAMLLIGCAGAGALAFYVKAGHDKVPSDERRAPVAAPNSANGNSTAQQPKGVTVLVPTMSGMDLTFRKDQREPPPGVDPIVFAVNEYLHEVPAVPTDARCIGVEIKDRTAILAFNPAFGNQTYGSEDEKIVLDGLRGTLGESPDVDQILLQVDGKNIDSLGHADLSEALPVLRVSTTTSTSTPNAAQRSQAPR